MAKRYTDTDKWKKSFIKSLPSEYKLFWLFILDECDHAGIWHMETDVAEMRLGVKLSLEKIRGLFKGKVVEFDGGTKLFIPDFIEFQYGELKPENKVHKSVIDRLEKYQLMGHARGLQAPMDKDKEMDKDKDRGGVGGNWESEANRKRPLLECLGLALNDDGWVRKNSTNQGELEAFNDYLTGTGEHEKTILDYKKHFHNLKAKSPEKLRKKWTNEELREMAKTHPC